jgi:hypothetical protein
LINPELGVSVQDAFDDHNKNPGEENLEYPTILAVQDPVRPCGGAGVCDSCAVWRTYVESRWTAWCHSSDNTSKLVPGPISKLVYYMISLLACSEFHGGISSSWNKVATYNQSQ